MCAMPYVKNLSPLHQEAYVFQRESLKEQHPTVEVALFPHHHYYHQCRPVPPPPFFFIYLGTYLLVDPTDSMAFCQNTNINVYLFHFYFSDATFALLGRILIVANQVLVDRIPYHEIMGRAVFLDDLFDLENLH